MFQLCTKQTLLRDFCSEKPEKQFCPFISAWTECHSLTLVVNSIPLNITQLNVNHVYIWISMFTNKEKLYCCCITFNGYYSLKWSMCHQSLSPLQKRCWPFSACENAPNSLLQVPQVRPKSLNAADTYTNTSWSSSIMQTEEPLRHVSLSLPTQIDTWH